MEEPNASPQRMVACVLVQSIFLGIFIVPAHADRFGGPATAAVAGPRSPGKGQMVRSTWCGSWQQ